MSKEKYSVVETENAYYIADNEEDVLLNVAVVVNRLNDYEHRLSNCIEPKFKVGQEVWCVKFMKIIKFKINKIEIYRGEAEEENRILYGNWEDMTYQIEENCFATEDEAKKHLEELKNGKV